MSIAFFELLVFGAEFRESRLQLHLKLLLLLGHLDGELVDVSLMALLHVLLLLFNLVHACITSMALVMSVFRDHVQQLIYFHFLTFI